MLSNNIKKYRKAQNMSQEELAIRIHVVRQTVSKWENSLSVPDADQLILLAEVLKVSVNDLLGTVIKDKEDYKSIVEELARANEQIARYAQEERIHKEARKIRGLMLWLTIISIAAMHVIKNEILAIAISSVLLIVILIILYRNILLLSNGNPNTQSIKAVTIFDIALVVVIVLFGVFVKTDIIHLTDNQEELFASALIAVIMVFVGIIAPMLPNNRHTGLRLPWTIQNEGAWNIAHKVLGIISIPLGLLYMSLTFFIHNMETLTLVMVAIWIGVPSLISLLYTYNLMHKK